MIDDFINLLSLIFMIILGMYFLYHHYQYQEFWIDGKRYMIEKNKESSDKNNALQTIYAIRSKLDQLIDCLVKKYPDDWKIKRLKDRFKNTIIKEANPNDRDPKKTSYTIDKGEMMVLCIRTRDGQLVDMNTLMYVAVHELTHIYSVTYDQDHNAEFWRKMKFMIEEASKCGVYVPIDYQKHPVKYCGQYINSALL